MIIAVWIIAICEVIRAIQNMFQILAVIRDRSARSNAYSEFVKSLRMSDREYVRRILEEFDAAEEQSAAPDPDPDPHIHSG